MPSSSAELLPLIYDPAYEHLEARELETEDDLAQTMRKIQATTFKEEGKARRAVHAKSHGVLKGSLQVYEGLPPHLSQGMFAQRGTYPVAIRLSSTPGDLLDDKVSTPRGMAVKIIGVEGARLEGSEHARTQDFVMVNGPAFMKSDGKGFLSSLKLLAATTDKAPGTKQVLAAALRGLEKVVESVGGESPTLKALGGHPITHPLGETFFSQTPFLYGRYMAKFSIAPLSPNLLVLKDAPVDLNGVPDGLRSAVARFFATQDAEWDLRVQLSVDIEQMPLEDAKVVWPETLSPYVSVARILVPSQASWAPDGIESIDEGLAFSVWHGLAAHRPLGSVNRLRKRSYEMARRYRAERSGHSLEEPSSDSELGRESPQALST
jgi:hypothetical protein